MERRGLVTWFDEIKGFGFVKDDEDGQEVFVHFDAIEREGFRTLTQGEEVRYTRTGEGGGPKADWVKPLD
ncbi:cold shock domain-containing protein [Desulfohalovibrio reitneri]|uniref:cold shock domain-containing protein n=1 Tax=Desulfohalovibrio reitneri TaxID=1307759 RepID=UPI0004A76C08|nr:cold shock domain-containing protein [Desulfohalovibrio reitneri]